MQVHDILRVKGSAVLSIEPTATLADVISKMNACKCGSLVVLDGESMVGIITERDILRASDNGDAPLSQVSVTSVMTTEIVTGEPADSVQNVMGLMTSRRIRHLPVLEGGRLAGMISIGDVVKALHDQLQLENHYLKNYIQSS